MARAITSPELVQLRADGQWSELFLAIHQPAAVFACRVNQSFDSNDDIYEITYDGVTVGAYTDVLPGMTCYVGSTAGAYDLGVCRVRKAPTASLLSIGRTSEIAWADDLYLTVVDEFSLWARHWNTPNETTTLMDEDVAYTDQNTNFDPCPVLGPDEVLWLTGATVSFTPTAAASWVIGSTLSGYAWTAPGASATANLTTVAPTLTYNAAGQYRVGCTVTAANGKSATGHRRVFVFDEAHPPITAFTLDNCAGDGESGGWNFSVTLHDQADLTEVRERAKVILFARDHYGNVQGSMGPIAGYEHIIASGWIDEEDIDWDAESGPVRFKVQGPGYWLSKLSAFPGGLKNAASTPTDWLHTQDLTMDKALHNLIHWRSTVDTVLDCSLTNDTRVASGLMAAPGSLWNQIKELSAKILAAPLCDRYGRLFIQTDPQYLLDVDRVDIPVVQAITKADWTERIRLPRKVAGELSQIETGGTDAASPYFSRSFGKVPGTFGTIESKDGWLVADQADLDARTGLYLARRNNPYPNLPMALAENNRMVDIAPRQYVTLSIAAGDTARGLTWTDKRLLPRRVELTHDPETGTLTTEIECEAETTGAPGLTVLPPQPPQDNKPPVVPDLPDFPDFPPPDVWFPDIIPNPDDLPDCLSEFTAERHPVMFAPATVYAGESATAYYPCTLAQSPDHFDQHSNIILNLTYHGDASAHTQVAAIDANGNTVLSPSGTYGNQVNFSPLDPVSVAGFKLWVEAGGLYEPVGGALASGTINVMVNAHYPTTGLDPAKVYCVTSTGGPWYPGGVNNSPQHSLGLITGGITQTGVDDPGGVQNRTYLHPDADGKINIYFSDSPTSDNSGSIGYAIYAARSNRYVDIRSASIQYVCKPS